MVNIQDLKGLSHKIICINSNNNDNNYNNYNYTNNNDNKIRL